MSNDRYERSFAGQMVCLALTVGILLGLGSGSITFAQANFEENVILLKFTASAIDQLNIRIVNGIVQTGLPSLDALNQQHKARAIKRILRDGGRFENRHVQSGLTRYYKLTFERGANASALVAVYAVDKNIETAHLNLKAELFDIRTERKRVDLNSTQAGGKRNRINATPNDPLYPSQWHYNNTGQTGGTPDADIDLPEAWDIETGDPSVVVADLDTGIDMDHPDLTPSIWVNPGEIPGNGIDDDANGYIDDVNGWDFSDDDNNPDDNNNHGSHTGGTVAAKTNNGIGVAGVAGGFSPGVQIMVCKIFNNAFVDVIVEAFTYAADNGSRVSTNSWGYTFTNPIPAIEAAIDYYLATTNGVVVFAAGNQNSSDPKRGYPSSYPPCISVAATNHNDVKASFSNYGTWVDISAPGVNVLSTIRDGYASSSGTSMACPHVAGVAALLFAANPGWTGAQVRAQLEATTDNIDALNPGFAGLLGTGRLNAHKALITGPFPNPPTNLQASVTGNDVQLTWNDPTMNTNGSPINLSHINVYRDGSEIAEVGPGVQTYADLAVPNGQHSYYVTATNAEGNESAPSNSVTVIIGTIDVVIWKHPQVSDPNVEEKARERGISVEQVRALLKEPTSHLALKAALEANGKSVIVVSDITSIDLFQFEALFAVVGAFPNNHVIPANGPEALAIENYIAGGGRVYMEGNDMWYWDPLFGGHDFGPSFSLDGLADSGGNFSTIIGKDFLAGMNFSYNCTTPFNDKIGPLGSAVVIHSNQSPAFDCGVAYNAGTYKTIGISHQFGCFVDGVTTKKQLMAAYLSFFGIGPPIANFSGNPTSGFVPLTVVFTDLSSGNITTWNWSFPGGTPSSATGPGPHTVVYNSAGTFNVSLTVSGPGGTDTETKTNYITALIAPDITVNPTSFDVVLPPGGTTTKTLTIGNVGGSNLTFSISEAEGTAAALGKAIRMQPHWSAGTKEKISIKSTLIPSKLPALTGYLEGKFDPASGGNPGRLTIGDSTVVHGPGQVIRTIPAPGNVLGLTYLNNSLWAVVATSPQQIMQLNPATGSVISSFSIGTEFHLGLANDGSTLWVCNFSAGKVERYTTSGTLVGSFNAPMGTQVRGIAYDGANLWIGGANHGTLYKTDFSGNVLQTVSLTTSLVQWVMDMEWIPQHGNGPLWIIDNAGNNDINQFNIVGASANLVKDFPHPVPSLIPEGIAHDGENLWSSAFHANLIYYIDDGIVEDVIAWLDENPKSGTVAPNTNVAVDIIFDASELEPGDYYANLVISSNDPDEQEVTVSPIHLLVATDAVIWIPSDVLEPNLAQKAQQRGLTLQEVRDLAVKPTSHSALKAALEANGKTVNIVNTLSASDLTHAQYLFVVLGIYPNNHVIKTTDAEVPIIQNFMAGGGKVYMEGGDVWYFDPAHLGGYDFGPSFSINATADGTNDLKKVLGSCIVAGKHFLYVGQNNFIDHISPLGGACKIHANDNPTYGAGVAFQNVTLGYRTIGNAFEFGGLKDNSIPGSTTKLELMAKYLEFFDNGIPPIADIVVAPANLNFGDVVAGSIKTLQLTIKNDPTATANLVVSSIIPPAGSPFSISGVPPLPITLAPGASQVIDVIFSPVSEGAQSGNLVIGSNDPDENPLNVPLAGNGVQTGEVVATAFCPSSPSQNCPMAVDIKVDMTGSSELLGSFTGSLTWNPTLLTYTGDSGLLSGFTGVINRGNVASGELTYNGAKPSGAGGVVQILTVNFAVNGVIGSSGTVDIEFSAMAAALTFVDLLPVLTVNDCNFTVTQADLLGDVNGDNLVNSTDALIILSFDVGLPIPPAFLNRINAGFGDTNSDALTNSTDALIILSFDVGITVPYPVGQPFCP